MLNIYIISGLILIFALFLHFSIQVYHQKHGNSYMGSHKKISIIDYYERSGRRTNAIDTMVMNITRANETICKRGLYKHACGNYNYHGDHVFHVVEHYNDKTIRQIRGIIERKNDALCYDTPCHPMIAFHEKCIRSHVNNNRKSSWTERIIKKLSVKLSKIHERGGHKRKNLASLNMDALVLVNQHGITNPISVRFEDNEYHIRPSGILTPIEEHKNNRLDRINMQFIREMYHVEIRHKKKVHMSVHNLKKLTGIDWMPLFNKSIIHHDSMIHIENPDYLSLLAKKLRNDNNFIQYMKSYVAFHIKKIESMDCLDLTEQLFPVTTCRIFLGLQHHNDHDTHNAAALHIMKNVYKEMSLRGVNKELRFGNCHALFYAKSSEYKVFSVESNLDMMNYDDHVHATYEHFMKNHEWNHIYNPIAIHWTLPSLLYDFNDPLHWFAQTNAWYDPYRSMVIVPPGLLRPPFYASTYNLASSFGRLGTVCGHELGHTIQDDYDKKCIIKHQLKVDTLASKRVNETFADVVGFDSAFHAFMKTRAIMNSTSPICDFFIVFAQTWCTSVPRHSHSQDTHSSNEIRVNIPIELSSQFTINHYNKCFGCNIIPVCTKSGYHEYRK
jgi:hypothetical protein